MEASSLQQFVIVLLVCAVIPVPLLITGYSLGLMWVIFLSETEMLGSILIAILPLIVAMLLLVISSISLTVRRLHDLGFSGLWILLNFILLINMVLTLLLAYKKGSPGKNKFGEDPLSSI
ncbi:MAG: DUF805 domain-containing protein [Campylobacter sp.]|nr:DUF805 domain-containing protein [Campylobacter sp.]